MLFNSLHFLVFFPIFLLVYVWIPNRFRWIWLTAASIYFYMSWKPEYIVLLMFCAVLNYYSAILIANSDDERQRKWLLWTSVVLNLSVIVVFKYLDFFIKTINGISVAAGNPAEFDLLNLVLPVGISFYTFHTMSYTIDVYRRETPVERHFGFFTLFVSFWPMLLAGPIERSNHLIPQFRQDYQFNYDLAVNGLNRIVYGLFKKMVVADRISLYVNHVYTNSETMGSSSLLVAMFFFSVQIYCDFSGYCDIALGCAQMLGYDLFENFNRPYLSQGISEFWARWHMSLGRWFRDYIYIPLGGSRVSKPKYIGNILTVFLVSGLWHGANWTFVFWGALHGFYSICEALTKDFYGNLWTKIGLANTAILKLGKQVWVFALVTVAWVFFRASSFDQAFSILYGVRKFNFQFSDIFAGRGPVSFAFDLLVIGLLWLSYLLPVKMTLKHNLAFIVVTSLLIFVLGKGGASEFIYFQF